jgi:AcrR family transcriptional regulator
MPKVTEAHVEARRSQILQAACRCFSRNGFDRTTIRQICEESGLSTGAVYGYFKSKGEIVEAMGELARQNTRELLFSGVTSDESPRALAQVIEAAFGFFNSEQARESTRLDVRLWGEALHTPATRELFVQALANLVEPFADIVRRGQTRGEINPELDPEMAARVIVALCLGFTVQKAMDPETDLGGCEQVISSLLTGSFTDSRQED